MFESSRFSFLLKELMKKVFALKKKERKEAKKLLKANMKVFKKKFPDVSKSDLKRIVIAVCQIPDPNRKIIIFSKQDKLKLDQSYEQRCKMSRKSVQ